MYIIVKNTLFGESEALFCMVELQLLTKWLIIGKHARLRINAPHYRASHPRRQDVNMKHRFWIQQNEYLYQQAYRAEVADQGWRGGGVMCKILSFGDLMWDPYRYIQREVLLGNTQLQVILTFGITISDMNMQAFRFFPHWAQRWTNNKFNLISTCKMSLTQMPNHAIQQY
jgi:hypothetical protein